MESRGRGAPTELEEMEMESRGRGVPMELEEMEIAASWGWGLPTQMVAQMVAQMRRRTSGAECSAGLCRG